MLVVVFHAGLPLRGGFVGVDVFFVISGFVITGMLLAELKVTGSIDMKAFYLRRVRRILPALAFLLAAVCVIAIAACAFGAQETAATTAAAASLFVANAALYRSTPGYFDVRADLNPLLHTWSLSVEEQFYAVFPLVLLASWAATRARASAPRRWTCALVVLLGVAGSFSLCWALTDGRAVLPRIKAPVQFAFYSSPTRAWEFGAGALLALAGDRISRLPRVLLSMAGVAGLGLIGWSATTFDAGTRFPGAAALLPVAGAALLVVCGSGGAVAIARLLSNRLFIWIGDRSYSWYLWHWPLVVFARALWPQSAWAAPLLGSVLSLFPAAASYRWLENPIRFAPAVSAARTLRLAGICIVLPLVAGALLEIAHRAMAATDGGKAIVAATAPHLDISAACEDPTPMNAVLSDRCTWKVSHARGRVLLIGDSNAGQFSEPVVRAANDLGYDVTVATFHACPFVDAILLQDGIPRRECRSFFTGTIRALAAQPPALIIVASASDGYIEERRTALRSPSTAETAAAPGDKARLWAEAEESALRSAAQVAPVLLIHPVPRFPRWDLQACAALTVSTNVASCGVTTARRVVDSLRRRAVDAERTAVAGVPRTRSLDLVDDLCTATACAAARDGKWMFRDGGHLTAAGALALTDRFRSAIAAQATP